MVNPIKKVFGKSKTSNPFFHIALLDNYNFNPDSCFWPFVAKRFAGVLFYQLVVAGCNGHFLFFQLFSCSTVFTKTEIFLVWALFFLHARGFAIPGNVGSNLLLRLHCKFRVATYGAQFKRYTDACCGFVLAGVF